MWKWKQDIYRTGRGDMSYMLKRPALKDLVLFCAKIEQGLV